MQRQNIKPSFHRVRHAKIAEKRPLPRFRHRRRVQILDKIAISSQSWK
jgi:hypothetical protein